nr:hypothetical protein [Streptomyces sp. HNM0574]
MRAAALTVTAAGAVVTGAGGSAVAADGGGQQEYREKTPVGTLDTTALHEPVGTTTDSLGTAADSLGYSVSGALGPVKDLQLNPLAKTGVDPLDNALATQVADFKPISTAAVTGPLAEGASLDELPLVGPVTDALPG